MKKASNDTQQGICKEDLQREIILLLTRKQRHVIRVYDNNPDVGKSLLSENVIFLDRDLEIEIIYTPEQIDKQL